MNFQAVRNKEITLSELIRDLTIEELRQLTDKMVDTVLNLISGCSDADVVFQPLDPEAHDPYAATPEEVTLPWTLGHVIVHTTASAEESAALAAELARGVRALGRSRYEVPWQEITSIESCRHRLRESRRMRLASLEMWPDDPHLDNTMRPWKTAPEMNAIGRFVLGLMHDDSHLDQVADIVYQAKAARL